MDRHQAVLTARAVVSIMAALRQRISYSAVLASESFQKCASRAVRARVTHEHTTAHSTAISAPDLALEH